MKKLFYSLLLTGLFAALLHSCTKDGFINSPNARLRIGADTLQFDTVFTSIGSVTQSFKIVNENDQQLRLSEIKLMGGNASAFKININGVPSNNQQQIDIAANDSLYVFVSVTIDPSAANLPFVVSDSISVQFNGNQRWVQLQAYGLNARFLNNTIISSNTTFNNNQPYVILGALRIADNVTLTIAPGTKIFAHADAPIIVNGTIIANGSIDAPIVFSGDRLDEPYKFFPASWPGIFFTSTSKNNLFTQTRILNAYQAIVLLDPSPNAAPKLTMQQSVIDNAFQSGLFCSNSSADVSNTLISNTASNIFIEGGGNYNFTHCTVVSYSNNFIQHKTPVLSVTNAASFGGTTVINPLQANFRNSIFWADNGFVNNEQQVNKQGSTSFAVNFNNCILKGNADPANASLSNVIRNQDPQFDSVDVFNRYYDFRQIKNTGAPGINAGTNTGLLRDLLNKPRNVGLAPDAGCYERQ
jgi:hypothetical protein